MKIGRGLPAGVRALGFVSLLMDTSSELVHSLLPVFMSSVLGAGMVTIGLVEGVAEGTAAIMKVFSGAISDRLGRRKLLVVCGYGLGAATKPLFPLAGSIGWVFAGRFVDRVGKGIRGAPRDALVADITPPELRGAAYGLRQALDSVGAFLGPLLAVILMAALADAVRLVLWFAVLPAIAAVVLLVIAVHEPAPAPGTAAAAGDVPAARRRIGVPLAEIRRLPAASWYVCLLGGLFSLARFSDAFLVLRARDVGLAFGYVPVVMIVMNVVYSVSAYPAGIASDRRGARALLVAGLAILTLADGVLAVARHPWHVLGGAALWGLHMGLTQGLLARLVADAAPTALRGTAFGVFNLVAGVMMLAASVVAGWLWSSRGAPAVFLVGAAFAVLAALGAAVRRTGR